MNEKKPRLTQFFLQALAKSLCGGGVPSSHPSLGLRVFFLFDPPQLRDLKAQIRSDLCRVINAMSPYEVLMNAPFHETPATSDLLDCDLKYDADTLEHFSSPFGYEGPECSFSSLF